MSLRHLLHIVSLILLALAAALALTALVSLYYADGDSIPLIACALGTGLIGLLGQRTTALEEDLSIREGYAVVSLSWIAIGIAGAVP